MKALIDADSMIYKAGYGVEEKIDWDDGEEPSYVYSIKEIKHTVDKMLDSILFATDCLEYELHLTGKNNFRDTVASSYKHNRADVRRPEWITPIKEYMMSELGAVLHQGMEADDVVVYLKTKYPEEYILCAIDKDVLYQTQGTHFNYGKGESVTVGEFDALKFKYYQAIAGDRVDGYLGVPGYGDKRTKKALADCSDERELWVATLLAYRSKGLKRSDAITTMRLADMHQFDGQEIILWTPPKK